VIEIPPAARELIESGALAHLTTLAADGSPRTVCIWAGLDGDEIVSGHLSAGQRKLAHVRRDPRVALSFESKRVTDHGLRQYLTIHGRARIQEGGAPELLQRLARVYIGPDVKFPGVEDPPDGFVMRITPERIGGVGPWART
jgi:PPOX class probable F420-dependent enzyme